MKQILNIIMLDGIIYLAKDWIYLYFIFLSKIQRCFMKMPFKVHFQKQKALRLKILWNAGTVKLAWQLHQKWGEVEPELALI